VDPDTEEVAVDLQYQVPYKFSELGPVDTPDQAAINVPVDARYRFEDGKISSVHMTFNFQTLQQQQALMGSSADFGNTVKAFLTATEDDGVVDRVEASQVGSLGNQTPGGRGALEQLLVSEDMMSKLKPGDEAASQSKLRIGSVPLPEGAKDQRDDDFFEGVQLTGEELSKTHQVKLPNEFLDWDTDVRIVTGTLDNVELIRNQMEGSGFEPVLARKDDGTSVAIGSVWVNTTKDSSLGPSQQMAFGITAVPENAPPENKEIKYENEMSLQVPMDKGATLFLQKSWTNQLPNLDASNEKLAGNTSLMSVQYAYGSENELVFSAHDADPEADGNHQQILQGELPTRATPAEAVEARRKYEQAAEAADSTIPVPGETVFIPLASRPDDAGAGATQWGMSANWSPVIQIVEADEVKFQFGDSQTSGGWDQAGFTPEFAFFAADAKRLIAKPGDGAGQES
jgi:hypothetical protein